MTPLTCPEVEERIDLYAADECAAPERVAIEQHLAHCLTCARSCEEARRLMGLLDLHWQQADGLERLRARIAEEARPRQVQRGMKRIWQPLRALAALLLVSFGLTWWLGADLRPEPDLTEHLVLAVRPTAKPGPRVQAENMMGDPARLTKNITRGAKAENEALTFPLDLGGRTPAAFREQVHKAAAELPKPPKVDWSLEIRNRGDRPMYVWIGGDYSRLNLDLRGPSVVTVPVRDPRVKPFGPAQRVPLAPGRPYYLPINRLVYGTVNEVRNAYWTEPGTYTLMVQLRTLFCWEEKGVERCARRTITSPPRTIVIQSKP